MADNSEDLIISISTDQATLRRSIQRIERDLAGLSGTVQKQFTAVGKSIDNSISTTMQTRINAMVGIGTKASKEWTGALADQGKELAIRRCSIRSMATRPPSLTSSARTP